MNAYLLAPLTAIIVSAVCGAAILARDASHRANRLAATIVFSCTFWSLCEVLWNTADDPAVVHGLVKLSAFGWIGIGPLFFELMLSATSHSTRHLRLLRRFIVPGILALGLCTWFSPYVTRGVVRTSWGWAYEVGALMPLFYVLIVSMVVPGIVIGWRAFRRSKSASERQQARILVAGITVPLVVASVTEAILPIFEIQSPRFGSLSLAVLCGCITYTQSRYGYSVLAPGRFQKEVFDVLPDGVAILHTDGTLRSGNAELARLVGASLAELEGTPLIDRFDLDVDMNTEIDLRDHECRLYTAAGGTIPVAVSSTLLRDKTESPIATLVVARDLREVIDLRLQLATQDRLAAVGQLAAGIAHEVNNPLSFAISNLNLLRAGWPKVAISIPAEAGAEVVEFASEAEEILDEAIEGVERAIGIVRDVKAFARGSESIFTPCALSDVVDNALRFAKHHFAPGVGLSVHHEQLPNVEGAHQDLEQVVLNLLLNAAQAVGESGSIRVETIRRDDAAIVLVQDDGPGIPSDEIERIFDPFFTTKPVGEGTGLGLAVSHEIVRLHGGVLRVASAPGGTRFEIEIPLPPKPI